MKIIQYILIITIAIGVSLFPGFSTAETENKDFDFLLVLTQQDLEMNWWFAVPSQFGPKVSSISEVVKGEDFKILPIFNNYGTTPENEANLTYDLEIIKPDGSIDESMKNVAGFKGPVPRPYLLPSLGMLVVTFDPEDPYGEYTVNVSAYDHVKNQKVDKSQKITLKKFSFKKSEINLNDWYMSYPTSPKPSLALTAFVNSPRPYFNDKGHPLWSGLWFFKQIYTENDFLIPHTIEFYKTRATIQQQKDIAFLFHLLNKIDMLPINDDLKEYVTSLNEINIPDPYQEITTGDQLDMLWAEFFATSRIKPVRQILTSLNLSAHADTLKKIKSGELSISKEVRNKANLDAVFQSALWSIMSNCKQSPLLFQYCVALYSSGQLNEVEKDYLGAMLKKVSEEKQEAKPGPIDTP